MDSYCMYLCACKMRTIFLHSLRYVFFYPTFAYTSQQSFYAGVIMAITGKVKIMGNKKKKTMYWAKVQVTSLYCFRIFYS